MYSQVTAYLSSQLTRVEVPIPKPEAPDPQDVVDTGNKGADWLAGQGAAFWTIAVVVVLAFLAMKALKNPLVKGAVIGVILLGIVVAIMNS